jgi:Protein of unknown function (DUF998)
MAVRTVTDFLNPARSDEHARAMPGVVALLVISALALGIAPLLMPASYSSIANTTSESAAQGVEYAWVARLGFLAFGLAVVWLAAGLKRSWARVAHWSHVAFGVLMIATAAFSHRPWVPGAEFDRVEDALHSFTATAMGFAFSFGVLARLMQRSRQRERGRILDGVALVAATVIPVLMARMAGIDGVIQRLLFVVAYLWYAREALLLRQLNGEAPKATSRPTPASGRR